MYFSCFLCSLVSFSRFFLVVFSSCVFSFVFLVVFYNCFLVVFPSCFSSCILLVVFSSWVF